MEYTTQHIDCLLIMASICMSNNYDSFDVVEVWSYSNSRVWCDILLRAFHSCINPRMINTWMWTL